MLRLGWRFRVLTERDIRSPQLDNAHLLLPFRSTPADELAEVRVFRALEKQGLCTIRELLDSTASGEEDRGLMLPSLWRMISSGAVEVDLNQRIGLQTLLTLSGSGRA